MALKLNCFFSVSVPTEIRGTDVLKNIEANVFVNLDCSEIDKKQETQEQQEEEVEQEISEQSRSSPPHHDQCVKRENSPIDFKKEADISSEEDSSQGESDDESTDTGFDILEKIVVKKEEVDEGNASLPRSRIQRRRAYYRKLLKKIKQRRRLRKQKALKRQIASGELIQLCNP